MNNLVANQRVIKKESLHAFSGNDDCKLIKMKKRNFIMCAKDCHRSFRYPVDFKEEIANSI